MTNAKQAVKAPGSGRKVNPTAAMPRQASRPSPLSTARHPGAVEDELNKLKAAAAAVRQIRLSAQRELEMARQLRYEAQKYEQEMATKARSQAQQLVLRTRLATQKDVEEMIRRSNAEIQKLLADIRVIRITAQEELAAQRKFTDAAKICTLSLLSNKKPGETETPKNSN